MAMTVLSRKGRFHGRQPTLRRWAWPVGLALLMGALALSTYNAVTTDRFAADLTIARFLQRESVGSFRDALFWLGVRGAAGALLLVTAVGLWRRGHRLEAASLVLILIPDASSFVLRTIYDRPRPSADLLAVYGGPQGASYPSGTALHWALFGGFMFHLLPALVRSRRRVFALRAFLVLWVLAVGLWVVHNGRHWPSDVLGGYLYGLLYLLLWTKLYNVARVWRARHAGGVENPCASSTSQTSTSASRTTAAR